MLGPERTFKTLALMIWAVMGARSVVVGVEGEDGGGETAVLSQRIYHLQQNRDELTRLSLNARHSFLTWPTWDDSMAKIRAFLQTAKVIGSNTH